MRILNVIVDNGATANINVGYGLLIIKNASRGATGVYGINADSSDQVHEIYLSPSGVYANITKTAEYQTTVTAASGALHIMCIGY